jgi:hypothetical protein
MALPVVLPAPIPLYRGDSRTLRFELYSDDAHTQPIDLTGYGPVVTAQLRANPDAELLEPLTVDASAAAAGVLIITVTPGSWAALAGVGTAGFDVQFASTDGSQVTTVLAGKVRVTKDFTHD